jgi:hypothetical protein
MAWRGYIRESISFVNPKGFKQWGWFLIRLPFKLILVYWWELKDRIQRITYVKKSMEKN